MKINNWLFSILLLSVLLRLANLDQSFWLDETATALQSARSLSQQTHLSADFHPPLYYYLVHFWMWGGRSEWFLRLISVLFGVGTVWIVYSIGKLIKNQTVGLTAAFLMAIAPYHIYYSQELRMYSLSAFLASVLIYALLTKRWVLHTLILVAGLYTLYIFTFMLPTELIFIYFWNRREFKKWLMSVSVSLMLFSFWIPSLIQQLSGSAELTSTLPEWKNLSSPGLFRSLPLTYAKFILGRITFTNKILYGLIVIASLFVTAPLVWYSLQAKAKEIKLLLAWLVLPIVLAFCISFWVPLNGPWRLLFALPAFYLLASLGLEQIKNKYAKSILSGGMVLVSLFGTFMYHADTNFHREDWKSAVDFIEQQLAFSSDSVVLFAFPEPFAPYKWYAKSLNNAKGVSTDLKVNPLTLDAVMSSTTLDKRNIYYFEYLSELTDHEKLISKWIIDNGYHLNQIYNFNGVGFIYNYEK